MLLQDCDDSLSGQSCNNTNDSDIPEYLLTGRSRKLSSMNKYERPLLDFDFDAKVVKSGSNAVSRPIKINRKNRVEMVSSSGSYDSNNEDDIFKKSGQVTPNNRYNGRKFSQNDIGINDADEKRNLVKRTQSW